MAVQPLVVAVELCNSVRILVGTAPIGLNMSGLGQQAEVGGVNDFAPE